jgi:hypothetical protein
MNKSTTALIKQIQEDYEKLHGIFEEMKVSVFQKDKRITQMARHPLFEIEPFEAFLRNEFITEEARATLFVQNEDEINPESEKLYTFTIDPETNQILHRIRYDENNNRHETVFEYTENFQKSVSQSVYGERLLKNNICYLFLKKGLPNLYLECTSIGVKSKQYALDIGRIDGYQQEHTFFKNISDVIFTRDAAGNIDVIKEYVKEAGAYRERPEILFKRPEANQTLAHTFKQIEDFLVTRITEQIQKYVQIKEEVYCLMLEYCMPEAFPPELAIGITPDLEGPYETLALHQLYNTPDLRYSYGEHALPVELYEEHMQYLYLFYYRAYNFKEYKRETFEYWNSQVREVYLNVCKRLMDTDFSASFKTSEHYLVMARGDVHDDTEYYYKRMKEYKK